MKVTVTCNCGQSFTLVPYEVRICVCGAALAAGPPVKLGAGNAVPLATPELPREIVASPIEAWRIWRVTQPTEVTLTKQTVGELARAFDEGRNPFRGLFAARLAGAGYQHPWPSRLEARCKPSASQNFWSIGAYAAHEAPGRGCQCGVWGFKDEAAVWAALAKYALQDGSPYASFAYGKVLLWGRVIEHENGYRAQHAKPVSLSVVGGDDETARELADFYGCPVVCVAEPVQVREARAAMVDTTSFSPGALWTPGATSSSGGGVNWGAASLSFAEPTATAKRRRGFPWPRQRP